MQAMELIDHYRIWDNAPHNAFPDLVRFQDAWWCCLREGDDHALGSFGRIRVLKSPDAKAWTSVSIIEDNSWDLRDPKITVTPDEKLHLLVGGSQYDDEGKFATCRSRVYLSEDGVRWSAPHFILGADEWLWRVTWWCGKAFGVSYRIENPDWVTCLWESDDGLHFSLVTPFLIQGQPNETTLRFTQEGEMLAILRREDEHFGKAWLGTSHQPPFQDWKWKELDHHLGGPNWIIPPRGAPIIGSRLVYPTPYGSGEKMVLSHLEGERVVPELYLPSGGDASYPGMVQHDGLLYVVYYSSHEGKSIIYGAIIEV